MYVKYHYNVGEQPADIVIIDRVAG